jgi:predicted DNA-binding ribbon-helix-helix protein
MQTNRRFGPQSKIVFENTTLEWIAAARKLCKLMRMTSEDFDIKRQAGDLNSAPSTPLQLVSGNVRVRGRRTSVRLEPALWDALREICRREAKSVHDLITEIAELRIQSTLTASIRVFLMNYFKAAATEDGHRRAGHGSG